MVNCALHGAPLLLSAFAMFGLQMLHNTEVQEEIDAPPRGH